jgi:predicted 3-demethylubiquinone-9 3-methyltransferase (glyoxalase superfamily)
MDITTGLWHNGNAREAANFYASSFPGSSVQDNWIAPSDMPGNKKGEEIFVEKIAVKHLLISTTLRVSQIMY